MTDGDRQCRQEQRHRCDVLGGVPGAEPPGMGAEERAVGAMLGSATTPFWPISLNTAVPAVGAPAASTTFFSTTLVF